MARVVFAVAVLALWCGAALVLAEQPHGAGGGAATPPPTPSPRLPSPPPFELWLTEEGACAQRYDMACDGLPASERSACLAKASAGAGSCPDGPLSARDYPLPEQWQQLHGRWRALVGSAEEATAWDFCPDLWLSPCTPGGPADEAFATWDQAGALGDALPSGCLRLLLRDAGDSAYSAADSARGRGDAQQPEPWLWVVRLDGPLLFVRFAPGRGPARTLFLHRLPLDLPEVIFALQRLFLSPDAPQGRESSAPVWYECHDAADALAEPEFSASAFGDPR